MSFGKLTKEFDHLQFIPVIRRMYDNNSVEEIKAYAGYSQLERFRKELATLHEFGVHKQLEISVDKSLEDQSSARKYSDGKMDTIFSVSRAKVNETYLDNKGKKRYRRKIKNAFIISNVAKSNKDLSYDNNHPPHCLNCGALLEAEGENYHCSYCRSEYCTEAYKYMLTRFFIEPVFRDLRFLWLIFIPAIALGILQETGITSEQFTESLSLVFSMVMGTLLTVLLLYALGKGLRNFLRDRAVKRKIRTHDRDFSEEVFTQRVNDLLAVHPELLISDKLSKNGRVSSTSHSISNTARSEAILGATSGSASVINHGEETLGIICRNVRQLQFCNYERENDLEIVECCGLADALFIKGDVRHVRLKDKRQKFTLRLARIYGVLTPVHYIPDQFTCPNCGSHQFTEHAGVQVCSHCHTELPMERIDWVIFHRA
ncbi:MAG: TFIIB-type zinc finger domain-containing protein [Eubacteriales bacterium]|nr:TFIIB-type zinc finger domain-containing protein [Eubacteriales bacterium]